MIALFAWLTVGYNVAVILWGAYVRATGSGAGCGSHWPLCNGAVIPRSASAETLVEYSHRLTSGLALLAVVALFVWTRRIFPPGHAARHSAAASVVLIIVEAAIGAGLVLFQLVADNASMARAMFMAVHLVNTFLLLGTLTLTAQAASGGILRVTARPSIVLAVFAIAFGLLIVGMSGAVAALGDTLYPARSLAEGMAADLSPASHALIRLRVLHPALAIAMAVTLIGSARRLPSLQTDLRGRRAAHVVVIIAAVQLAVGFANVLLLAPVWLQMVHLLLADLLWIAFVLAGASVLAAEPVSTGARRTVHAT
jgi:heme A synthase